MEFQEFQEVSTPRKVENLQEFSKYDKSPKVPSHGNRYLTFIEEFFSQKLKMAPLINMAILASFSRSSHIRQEFQNAKIFADYQRASGNN
jgi:hypothetical protein